MLQLWSIEFQTNGGYFDTFKNNYRNTQLCFVFLIFLSCLKITSIGLKLDKRRCTTGYCYNKALVKFDLVQHQISFARSSDACSASLHPTSLVPPSKTNMMWDSSNKCLALLSLHSGNSLIFVPRSEKVDEEKHIGATLEVNKCIYQ